MNKNNQLNSFLPFSLFPHGNEKDRSCVIFVIKFVIQLIITEHTQPKCFHSIWWYISEEYPPTLVVTQRWDAPNVKYTQTHITEK